MDIKEAYRIVYEDIINNGLKIFSGIYDARYGNKHFMFGIGTVMEQIAMKVSEEAFWEYNRMFDYNMQVSEKEKDNGDY